MDRVLITGGAGYLGSTLCEKLLRSGHRVTVLDSLLYGPAALMHLCAHPGFDFIHGDARNRDLLERLIRSHDVVVPLAAIVGAPACDRLAHDATTTNRDAVILAHELCSNNQLVIYPTTNSGYGTQSGTVLCTEDTPLEPISLYGRTKVEAERRLLEHENVVTFRLATVFGASPRMRLDLLVNHFVYAAVTDGTIVIFEKDFKRNYLHVRDVADAILHAMLHRDTMCGRAFNVGLDEANLSKAELAEKIKSHVPDFYIHYAEYGRDPDQRNYIVSNERLAKAGFVARRDLDEGILELLSAYRMFGRAPMKNVTAVQGRWLGDKEAAVPEKVATGAAS